MHFGSSGYDEERSLSEFKTVDSRTLFLKRPFWSTKHLRKLKKRENGSKEEREINE